MVRIATDARSPPVMSLGEDIDRWMVREGWALSFIRYSHVYDADEKAAREQKAGLWAGCFIAPWEWRARNEKTVLLGSVCPVGAQKDSAPPKSAVEAPSPGMHDQGKREPKGRVHLSPAGRALLLEDQDGPTKVSDGSAPRPRPRRRVPEGATVVVH